MPQIGVIADDLTGATTTGVLLARSGARVSAFFNEIAAEVCESANQFDAVIISSNSRALSKEHAYEKVSLGTQALKRMGVKYFTKRTDTTLRGGIGVEIDAMLDQMGDDAVAVMVPAMPQSRRILVGGYSVIEGTALIKTPVANDVRTPVRENYVPKLISSQTKRKVDLISLSTVLAGEDAIRDQLQSKRREGTEIFVVDAISADDIETISKACVSLNWNILAVDPGAFTSQLAYQRGLTKEEKANEPEQASLEVENKTVLIIVGSATSVTKKQIGILCEDERNCMVSANPKALITSGEEGVKEVERVSQEIIKLLQQEKQPRAIIIETAITGEILNLGEEDAKRGYNDGESAGRINAGLGRMVLEILEKAGREKIAGLYTTGGDTMVSVCFQLGVQSIELIDYVIPQTDIGRLVGAYDGMPIIGKGGLTGNDMTACHIVERLFKEAGRTNLVENGGSKNV